MNHRITDLSSCYSIADLRLLAKRRLPKGVFEFFDGGAEHENTLRANVAAFAQVRWRPHTLRDVSQVSLESSLFGSPLGLPMGIGPTGGLGFGHPGADLALAKAAASHGIPYTLSSSATTSIEDIAKHAPGRLWFQAYILKDQDHFWSMIERARAAHFEALVITVDLPVGGKRERDFHNHFAIPFRLTPKNMLDMAQHPLWLLRHWQHGFPTLVNLEGSKSANPINRDAFKKLASTVGRSYDAAFDVQRLAEVRQRWRGKLIVKGILRPDDALQIARLGVDAIVVSNHGGRQLDGAIASLHALPSIVQAVGQTLPVWLDGGIRRGADVAAALAVGASGVLLGRASLYGSVSAAESGAQRALDILAEEFKRTLQLCGAKNVQELTSDLVELNA